MNKCSLLNLEKIRHRFVLLFQILSNGVTLFNLHVFSFVDVQLKLLEFSTQAQRIRYHVRSACKKSTVTSISPYLLALSRGL